MKRKIIVNNKEFTMPKMSIDTYTEYLELAEIVDAKQRYSKQDIEAMSLFICKAYGDQFTVEELKNPETGLDAAGLILEFQFIDMSRPYKAYTVEKDMKYHVMLTAKGAGELYVESTNEKDGYFVVKGTPKLEFYWEVKIRQKGCRDTRIEQSDIPEKEDVTAEEQEMTNEQIRNQLTLLHEMERDEIEVQEGQTKIIERMEEIE